MAVLPALAALLLIATPVAAMDGMEQHLGAALFDKLWVPAPASTRASDGLGPLYNARSCASCHSRAGRGRMPAHPGDPAPALVLRLGAAEDGRADPLYGRQIQDRAIQGHQPEARLALRWTQAVATLFDAAPVTLRRPWPELALLHGPLAPDTAPSLRLAPPLAGRGGLETVPEAAILARQDPEDRDGDGISGRANRVDGQIGRFGHKAAFPGLIDFTATAFATDIGIGSPLRPGGAGDCALPACLAAPAGGSPAQDGEEIGSEGIALVTAYLRGLAVPRAAGGEGAMIFAASGCSACHVPALPGPAGAVPAYTDLLLHDMGEGLSDGLAEGAASGNEWRTAPLIGLRSTQPAGGGGSFLHDGRAADLTQAILWHGGEAAAARDRFAALPAADRAALLRFLDGL